MILSLRTIRAWEQCFIRSAERDGNGGVSAAKLKGGVVVAEEEVVVVVVIFRRRRGWDRDDVQFPVVRVVRKVEKGIEGNWVVI